MAYLSLGVLHMARISVSLLLDDKDVKPGLSLHLCEIKTKTKTAL